MKAAWVFLLGSLVCAAAARAEPTRILLSVGSNLGMPEDHPLHYADADARRFRDLMVELGQVRSSRAYLLEGATATTVRDALTEIRGRVAELRAHGDDVVLLLFLSSHAKAGYAHLKGTLLALSELRELAGGVEAPLRVLILDTCESGVVVRHKGGSRVPGFELKLERLPLHGEVVLSSTGPAESAEDWDSLGSSLFTHYLMTGLRGDADRDGDGRVTLYEAYGYAYRRTVSAAAFASQHPSADIDLAGSGELTLTQPGATGSALDFPGTSEGSFTIVSQPEPNVVLEVDKRAGPPLRLAVPPGRYLVRKKEGAEIGLLSVELPYGGTVVVDEHRMVKRAFTEVSMKGGYVDLKSSTVLAGAQVSTPPILGTGPRWLPFVGYRQSFGLWFVEGDLLATEKHYSSASVAILEKSAHLELTGGYRVVSLPWVPYFAVGLKGSYYEQTYVREQEQQIEATFGVGPIPPRRVLGLNGVVRAGLEIPLPENLLLVGEVQGEVGQLPVQDTNNWNFAAAARVGLGFRF
jgi:hypothetical protein